MESNVKNEVYSIGKIDRRTTPQRKSGSSDRTAGARGDSSSIEANNNTNTQTSQGFSENSSKNRGAISDTVLADNVSILAVPESSYKKLWVVSAYISKKEALTQAPSEQSGGMSLPSRASDNRISQSDEIVNRNSENSSKNRGSISDKVLKERDASYLKAEQAYEADPSEKKRSGAAEDGGGRGGRKPT